MNKIVQKITSTLLAVLITLSLCPAVFAADGNTVTPSDVSPEPEIVVSDSAAEEESDPTEDPAPAEDPEPTEDPDASEEPVDDETAEEGEEVEEGEEEAEEPVELPYGLVGMPEDYVLSEAALAEKAALADVVAKLANLTPGKDYVENEVLTTAASKEEAELIAAAFNGTVEKYRHGMVTITLLDCTVLEAVTAASNIELPLPAVSPNYITSVKPIYSDPGSLNASSVPTEQDWESWVRENMSNPDEYLLDPFYNYRYQWHHDVVDTYAAWGVSTGRNVTVAVLDTGVDASHEDLGGRVSAYDVGYGTAPKGDHATHVAGIIAAEMDNGVGGAGIAPDADIISYCVFDDYGDTTDDVIIDAIYDAVDKGAWIINMSLGGPHYNYCTQLAIDYAYENGVTCIASMGNEGTNAMMYPAAFNHVIAVTASNRNNGRAWYSNYGNWSDVSAPGSQILSTIPGGYDIMDGTSMATPVVSGLAALYMSSVGHVSPDTMEKVLEKSRESGVVNGAKMFRVEKEAPGYYIETENGIFELSDFGKNPIPCESTLWLFETVADRTSLIIYTTDGKTPSIKNGEIVNGEYLDVDGIDLSEFAGKTVTVKAARVTGMGVLSKVLTLKLKIAESIYISDVSIDGPETIVSGKAVTFKATVFPEETAVQDVTWSIVEASSAMNGATIDAKGNLKTVEGCEGYVIIRAQSVADPQYYADLRVDVKILKPVAKITLTATKKSVGAGYDDEVLYQLWDADGMPIDPELSRVEIVSSKPDVVQVLGEMRSDGLAMFSGLKKGSSTITIKAMDGSKKSAKFTVTVTQPVESLSISGQWSIAPGASATFKATASPSTANNKKVTWELIDAPAGVTISTKGVVKVPADVPLGEYFTVRAHAADGFGVYEDYEVYTDLKCTKVYVGYEDYTGEDYRPVWKNGSVSSVELYTVHRPDYMAYDETSIILYGYCDNGQYGNWTCSSSAVSIETFDGYCTVKALKTGTAKLTCAAMDGSGKKATVTIKVVTPASRVSIDTTAPRMTSETPYVAFGKSISFKAAHADTYGKPSNKKVTWYVNIYETDEYGSIDYDADWTDFFLSNKLCTISSSGKLTVKKGVQDYWYDIDNDFKAVVSCMDAYYNTAEQEVYLIPPTSYVLPFEKTVNMPSGSEYVVYFESDQWNPGFDSFNNSFVATSSNPKVAGVYTILPVWDEEGYVYTNLYQIIFTSGQPGVKGKATITIKAADSGKSAKITVNVNDKYA